MKKEKQINLKKNYLMKNEKTQNQGTEDTERHAPSDNEDKNNA